MKTLALLLLLSTAAFASKRPDRDDYQDGVLVSLKQVVTGSSCSQTAETRGDIDATTDKAGSTSGTVKATTTGSADCRNISLLRYTVEMSGHTYIVQESYRFLDRKGFLNGLPIGTHIQVRVDSKGIYIEKGGKETKYDVIEAR